MPLFSRKSSDAPAVTEPEAEVEAAAGPRAYTPGKGKATPKRTSQRRRVAAVQQPRTPEERREAKRLAREQARSDRQEAMAGMRSGDERHLLPRDKGPVRRLVRDIVDSRRNVGSYFFGATLIIFFLMMWRDPRVALFGNLLWLGLGLAVIVDSFILSRKIKKLVKQHFPKSNERMGSLYFYGIMRAISFRRMRMPNCQVKIGDPIVPGKA
ncbi:DUF3043 domain-containing protein [Catellatospora sp. KI3]|uniref:DUF3043 domain-containing protein n=1 Tax=Catellatospora sp. KI3 TaxID=3041620 RepID=UPI00248217E9|nr:DUF3043 domain-containing protein [Catellatospora sp. KI3]MDI1466170.1 DUF3043 domain-containing protein [Catellatospora sp. KI3]